MNILQRAIEHLVGTTLISRSRLAALEAAERRLQLVTTEADLLADAATAVLRVGSTQSVDRLRDAAIRFDIALRDTPNPPLGGRCIDCGGTIVVGTLICDVCKGKRP